MDSHLRAASRGCSICIADFDSVTHFPWSELEWYWIFHPPALRAVRSCGVLSWGNLPLPLEDSTVAAGLMGYLSQGLRYWHFGWADWSVSNW